MPGFLLTRRAARDLRAIHEHSVVQWGGARADRYLADLYTVLNRIAAHPGLGSPRAHRSTPFLMVPSGRHFIVYDRIDDDVVVLTVLHQVRDIERIIATMGPAFLADIEAARRRGSGGKG